jgi:N-acetylglucosaminyl-diphospho-decaprenol L-rhamnosyltransferase
MDLSVVLVHYQSPAALRECLRTLEPELSGPGAEVVVVDNDSRDGTPAALAASHPRVRVIANDRNLGYAKAVNQGLAATSGAFALVMNPDCEVRPGAVRALSDYLRGHSRTGVAGPRIENPDGTVEFSARSFPDHFTFLFNRYSLLTRLFPGNRWSRRYLLSDWDHASEREVDWLSGACLMVRREAVREVGGMDEAFFMFNEDVDWCRRMKAAGWAVAFVSGAVVVHHVGASRKRVAPKVIVERHRGMIHYFHKHHPANPLLEALAAAAIWLRAGVMLAQNAFKPRA